jgi:hypothetical protein
MGKASLLATTVYNPGRRSREDLSTQTDWFLLQDLLWDQVSHARVMGSGGPSGPSSVSCDLIAHDVACKGGVVASPSEPISQPILIHRDR